MAQTIFNQNSFTGIVDTNDLIFTGLDADKLVYCDPLGSLQSVELGTRLIFDINGLNVVADPSFTSITATGLANQRMLKSQNGLIVVASGNIDYQNPLGFPGTAAKFLNGDQLWSFVGSDDVVEGKTNLFFSDSRARLSISATAPLSYDNTTGVMSIVGSGYEPAITASTSDKFWDGTKVFRNIEQADVTGLKTTDSPYFQTIRLLNVAVSKLVGTNPSRDLVAVVPNVDYSPYIQVENGLYKTDTDSVDTIGVRYNTTNLKLTAGQINTIQDIATGSSPTFSNITFNALIGSRLLMGTAGKQLTDVTLGNSLSLSGTTLDTIQDIRTSASVSFTGITLSGATADRLVYTNGSKALTSASLSSNLTLTTGTLDTVQGIQTSSSPQFSRLSLGATPLTDRILYMTGTVNPSGNAFGWVSLSTVGSSTAANSAYGSYTNNIYTAPASMSGSIYSMYIDLCSKSGSGTPASAYGAYILSPNVSATVACGIYSDSLGIGAAAWTDRSNATGCCYILNNIGLGAAPLSYMGIRMGGTQTGATNTNVFGILMGRNMNLTTATYGCFGFQMSGNNFDIPAGGAYNVFGIDVNGSSMTKSGAGTITYSMAARLLMPNVSATYSCGMGCDSLVVSSSGLPWTDRSSAMGQAYISGCTGIGVLPATDRLFYTKNTTQTYNSFFNCQPTSSSGSTAWYGNYIYTSSVSLSGGSATIYGLYVSTVNGGSTANCVASYGGYFNNIGASSTSTNNYALFATDLVVGSNAAPGSLKPTNGIYSSGGIAFGETTLTKYKEGSATLTYTGGFAGTRTVAVKYIIIGKMVTLSFAQDTSIWTSATTINFAAGQFPSEIRPAAVKNLPMTVIQSNSIENGGIQISTDGSAYVVRAPWQGFLTAVINGFISTSINYDLS